MTTQYASFSKFQVNDEHQVYVDAAYLAGRNHKLAGNQKLPRFAEIAGKKFPVVGSLGDAGQAFVKGWKSVSV